MLVDVGRYLFWVQLREILDPAEPEMVRALASTAAFVRRRASPGVAAAIRAELRLSFPELRTARTIDRACRSALDLQAQCLLEELVLGRIGAEHIDRYMRWDGREHLDAALAKKRGVVLLFPHAGNVMMLIARLALSGYDLTQVAARGFLQDSPELARDLKPTWLNRRVRAVREAEEDRLPARYLPIGASVRELYRALAANGIVAIAFDGRGGSSFRPTPFLGRTALLSTGPYKLAVRTGAAVVPAFCVRDGDRVHRLVLGEALSSGTGDEASRCAALLDGLLAWVEPRLRQHPDHYGAWLGHCRRHAGMDDHPLFADTAVGSGWERHRATEW